MHYTRAARQLKERQSVPEGLQSNMNKTQEGEKEEGMGNNKANQRN